MNGKMRFTSLLLVEERLLEAEHFALRLRCARATAFHYELNAFLSAARSVTFLMQKEMSDVPGWCAWWADQRVKMSIDPCMRFFLLQRNHSQKAGRVRIAGTAIGNGRVWTYRFVGGTIPVPAPLRQRDVAEACREHLAKLAHITLACIQAFPYHANPRRALTPEGVASLSLDLDGVDAAIGFPRGWTHGLEPFEERIRVLGKHFDGPDELEIARLARSPRPRRPSKATPSAILGETLLTHLVDRLEDRTEPSRCRLVARRT